MKKYLSLFAVLCLLVACQGKDNPENNSKVPVPQAVDLGLSVKWASFNVGSSQPEQPGDFFAWGDPIPYYLEGHAMDNPCSSWREGKEKGYNFYSYKWSPNYSYDSVNGNQFNLIKYCQVDKTDYWDGGGTPDGKTKLEPNDDAAYYNLGGKWRMPTDNEWRELVNNCTWTWTTKNGVQGQLVTASNGNSIFLPAAGQRSGVDMVWVGNYSFAPLEGCYYSSTLSSIPCYGLGIQFGESRIIYIGAFRESGLLVRPVMDKE